MAGGDSRLIVSSKLIEKLKKLKCPYLRQDEALDSLGISAAVPILFDDRKLTLNLYHWLFKRLGFINDKEKNIDLQKVLLNVAVEHGFISKERSDIITGKASFEKQAAFLSLLLGLVDEINVDSVCLESLSAEEDRRIQFLCCDRSSKLRGADIKLHLPRDLQVQLDAIEESNESFQTQLKQKIKILEDEIQEKQMKLKELPDITPPTKEQYARLRRVTAGIEGVSKKFSEIYNNEMAVWCTSKSGETYNDIQSSLGHVCLKVNEQLDLLVQTYADSTTIKDFYLDEIPRMRSRADELYKKLDKSSLAGNVGPSDIEVLDEMASVFERAVAVEQSSTDP